MKIGDEVIIKNASSAIMRYYKDEVCIIKAILDNTVINKPDYYIVTMPDGYNFTFFKNQLEKKELEDDVEL